MVSGELSIFYFEIDSTEIYHLSFTIHHSYFGEEMFSHMPFLWWVGFSLYLFNIGVGVAAQLKVFRAPLFHHLLYFFVFLGAIAAFFSVFHPFQLLTVSALLYMPRTKPPSKRHIFAAVVGLFGYLGTLWQMVFLLGGG